MYRTVERALLSDQVRGPLLTWLGDRSGVGAPSALGEARVIQSTGRVCVIELGAMRVRQIVVPESDSARMTITKRGRKLVDAVWSGPVHAFTWRPPQAEQTGGADQEMTRVVLMGAGGATVDVQTDLMPAAEPDRMESALDVDRMAVLHGWVAERQATCERPISARAMAGAFRQIVRSDRD